MTQGHIQIGDFKGYLAGEGPGIVVLQEIFGINAGMRAICDRLAGEGFAALCPDLFWRLEPGLELDPSKEADMKRAFDLFAQFDVNKGVDDIAATIAVLRAHKACTGKVGAIGYCLGGQLAYLTAARTDADAAVGYYGVNIENLLGEAANITKPLMLHIAGADAFVPKEAQDAITKGLASHERITLHQYDGLEHAFARPDGEHYDKAGATSANERTSAFLKAHL